MADSSEFIGQFKQLPGQQSFQDLAHEEHGTAYESGITRSWGRLPVREQDIYRPTANGREHIGFFDTHGRKVLNTDKFSIPERPKPQGQQLGFDQVQAENAIANGAKIQGIQDLRNHVSRAFLPTDPVLHSLRQQNPKLNDYQFQSYPGGSGETNQVIANHKPFTTAIKPLAGREKITYDVGHLDWRNAPDLSPEGVGSADRTYGKIEGVATDAAHRGQGVAEGLWDYATALHDKNKVGTAPMHDTNRSMLGDIWARRVGGPTPTRTEGHEVYQYDV